MARPDGSRAGPALRCAIYTRKSSEEGLEQEFNSLDAQREACAAYIVSQRHSGWTALPQMYDDGGVSGGTMDRPALQRLLGDVKAGRVDIVVVYKVDRLTRSLSDFAKIVDILDAHDASFVSVTQQFNTTTSMGRLTLNMLLSFAQFERDIAGERIRDKIAASKKRGMWMGGSVPLGYDAVDRRLVVNEAEAETVRLIFRRYAELGSVSLLGAELDERGIVSKKRMDKSGRCEGGRRLSRGALYLILQNRVYRGEITHKGASYPGQHQAIVDPDLWQIVQDKLATNRKERALGARTKESSLLAGLIVDASGEPMTPSHAVKAGRRYRYYVSAPLITRDRPAPDGLRIPAGDVEALVLDRLRAFLSSTSEVGNALRECDLEAHRLAAILDRSARMARAWPTLSPVEIRTLVRSVVAGITVETSLITLKLDRFKLLAAVQDGASSHPVDDTDADPLILTIEASLRRAGKGKRLVIGEGMAGRADPALVKLIAKAHQARKRLFSGSDESIGAMARRLGTNRGRLTRLIRVSWLAPDIVGAILEGRHPIELTPTRLLAASKDLPHGWAEQRRFLGIPAK
jgi:DNA invertase Pin-like site-specific DNA recombinase